MIKITLNTWWLPVVVCSLLLLFPSCQGEKATQNQKAGMRSIIPLPRNMTEGKGSFNLQKSTVISLPDGDVDWSPAVNYLVNLLEQATGSRLTTQEGQAGIIFRNDPAIEHQEGYRLTVDEQKIEIHAKSVNGALYGVQSLLQLMPTGVFSQEKSLDFPLTIPGVVIEDAPRFSYRGIHLDVGRHFFGVEEIKRFIDAMALHKYNTFHWHLTEDQGWRIEIKQYPKLTEVGGFRKETLVGHYSDQPHQFDGKRYGGFYTQEEVKEVIAFASERGITIIPEIELPGHAQAAIAAYPELGCLDEKVDVMTIWGVSDNVYCPTEETFTFLENVIDEVAALFPGEYFHIGGDECPKTQWKQSTFCQNLIKKEGLKDEFELQSYFIRRIEKMLNARGKRLIGWDEILEGGLAPDATVMSWRGIQGGIEAAHEGHDVIMTPTSHCYLDYYQSLHPDEPLAIGGFLPVEKVYSFDPVPDELPADKHHHILGGQANIWTEYIPTFDHLMYMTYPRAVAMAEVLWTPKAQRDYGDFSKRLTHHFNRFEANGLQAAQRFFDVEGKITSANGNITVALQSNLPDATITYTADGSEPSSTSTAYTAPFEVQQTGLIKAATFSEGIQKGKIWQGSVSLHKAVGKPISLTHAPAEKYGSGGEGIITNGIFGSDRQFSDKEWLGFNGKDLEAVIELGEETEISSVKCRFFKDNGAWVYLPKKVSVYTSGDGQNFTLAGATEDISAEKKVANPVVNVSAKATYLKIVADRFGIIPEGATGASNEAWLFVGELEVQ